MTSHSLSYPRARGTIQLPYGAWHQDRIINLPVPGTWVMRRLDPDDGPALSPAQIEAAIQAPIGTQTIREIATRKRSAILVVEDITRPTRVEPILAGIIQELKAGGLSEDRIAILFATGAHRPMTQEEIDRKVPRHIRRRIKVHVHDFVGNDVEFVGWIHGGPVYLNRLFLQADMRICVGTVMPHNETGFGGGAKLVIPGVAGRRTIAFLHGALPPRPRGNIDSEGSRPDRRSWLEAVVRQVGLDIVACSVINATREIAGFFVGDMLSAYRAAAERAQQIGRTHVDADDVAQADAVLVNAYPLDTDPIQVGKGISTSKAIGAKSTIVVTAASNGVFYHGMGMGCGVQWARLVRNLVAGLNHPQDIIHFMRGARSTRHIRLWARYSYFCLNHLPYRRFLENVPGNRDDWNEESMGPSNSIFMYSPGFPAWGFRQRYAGESLFKSWERLCSAFMRRSGKESVTLLVLPCAPMQIPCVTACHRE